MNDIAGADREMPGNRSVTKIYIASVGGLFESDDEGSRWTALHDNVSTGAAVSSVAISPQNPDELWIATGDMSAPMMRAVPGAGVYRSLDGGKHWVLIGFREVQSISFVRFDPRNPGTIYVGVAGNLERETLERGLYRSTDGGKSWERVLWVNGWTGAVDISFDPSNPAVIYAAMQQQATSRRLYVDYGPGSGLYKSTDGGTTWHQLSLGLPDTTFLGRCAIAIAPSMPTRVYAIVDSVPVHDSHKSSTRGVWIYRSDDAGQQWRREAKIRGSSFTYWGHLYVDPANPQRVYITDEGLGVSDDGGITIKDQPRSDDAAADVNVGVDSHALWIDPKNSAHLILGNDHGIFISYTAAATWRHIENLILARVYGIGLDSNFPFTHVIAAMQDSSNFMGPLRSAGRAGITNNDWRPLRIGAENGNAVVDPSDENTIYSNGSGGLGADFVQRQDLRNDEMIELGPGIQFGSLDLPSGRRGTLVITQRAPRTIYVGSTRIYSTVDHGAHWEAISPVFSRIPLAPKKLMGFTPRMADHYGMSGLFDTVVTAIAPSPINPSVIYTGTRDGVVAVTRDAGRSWHQPRLPRILLGAEVTGIAASSFYAGRVYISFTRFYENDFKPYILESDDYGAHWRSAAPTNIPAATVWGILEHPGHAGIIFAATDRGVIATTDDGVSWFDVGTGLPNIRVNAIALEPKSNDLVAGTWGRGIWVLDDITPLTQKISSNCPALFHPAPASEYLKTDYTYYEAPVFTNPNPPDGATISYYLPNDENFSTHAIEVQVKTVKGEIIQRFQRRYAPGLNQVSWDLRLPPLWKGGTSGPFVLPGVYEIDLKASQTSTPCSNPLRSYIHVTIANASSTRERNFRRTYAERLQVYYLSAQVHTISVTLDALIHSIERFQKASSLQSNPQIQSHLNVVKGELNAIGRAIVKQTYGGNSENSLGPQPASYLLYCMGEELNGTRGYSGTFSGLMPAEKNLLREIASTVQHDRERLRVLMHREGALLPRQEQR